MKASAYIPEAVLDPKLSNSAEPNEVAFNLAFSTSLAGFPWFELPENAYRLRRFGIGMKGAQQTLPTRQGYACAFC